MSVECASNQQLEISRDGEQKTRSLINSEKDLLNFFTKKDINILCINPNLAVDEKLIKISFNNTNEITAYYLPVHSYKQYVENIINGLKIKSVKVRSIKNGLVEVACLNTSGANETRYIPRRYFNKEIIKKINIEKTKEEKESKNKYKGFFKVTTPDSQDKINHHNRSGLVKNDTISANKSELALPKAETAQENTAIVSIKAKELSSKEVYIIKGEEVITSLQKIRMQIISSSPLTQEQITAIKALKLEMNMFELEFTLRINNPIQNEKLLPLIESTTFKIRENVEKNQLLRLNSKTRKSNPDELKKSLKTIINHIQENNNIKDYQEQFLRDIGVNIFLLESALIDNDQIYRSKSLVEVIELYLSK